MGRTVKAVATGGLSEVARKAKAKISAANSRGSGSSNLQPRISQAAASANLAKDIAKGQELLGGDFKEGNLDRIDAGRGADISSVIEGRRAALGGFSAEANQALRDRAGQGIDRGTQSALRSLRGIQGASGVRGASAAAQQGRQLSAGQAAKANAERDLLIRNVDQKGKALSAFEQSVGGAEETEQQRNLFNIQQRQKEIAGRQAAGLGFAQLGVTERTGAASANIAGSAASSGGKK